MPQDRQWPEWLTGQLIAYLINKSRDNPGRQAYVRNSKRFRRWYRGEMFLAPTEGLDDMTVNERNAVARRNIIGETVDELSSIFLKNAPIIRRLPFVPQQAHLSDGLDSLWIWAWEQSMGQEVFRSIMEDAQITGIGAAKVFWDPRKANKHYPGQIMINHIPGAALYVDPDASNSHMGQDVTYIVQHMRRYPEEIVAKYGDAAAEAIGWRSAAGKDKSYWGGVMSMLSLSNRELTSQVRGRNPWPPTRNAHKDTSMDKVDLYETWLFPDKMYGAELTTGDKTAEKYRFGLVATSVNDKIIRVKPNPCVSYKQILMTDEYGVKSQRREHIGHGTHPFVFLHWRPVADDGGNRRFYDAMSMVEWQIPLQFNVNALRRNLAIILRTLANPTISYNEDALATPANKVVMVPGQMFKVRGQYRIDEAIRINQGAQMPMEVLQMIAEDMQGIKEAGGVKAGVTGLFPAPGGGTSHTPAETIGTLQQAAFAPLWKYVNQVGNALVQASVLYDGLIQQNFKPGHYMGASRRGEAVYMEWTGDHVAAQFRRIVVSGATTPIYDLEREQREASVLEMTLQALQSSDPRIMRATMIFLDNLVFPWTDQYIQLLQEELARTEQMGEQLMVQGMQGMQDMGSAAGQQQGQPLALPEGGAGQQEGQPGVDELAAELGVSPEQLLAAARQ